MVMSTTEERLKALEAKCLHFERALRNRTRMILFLIIALLAIGVWSLKEQASTRLGVVEAEAFLLRGKDGTEVGSLRSSEAGFPVLTLLSDAGAKTVLGDRGGLFTGPALTFRDAQEHERLVLCMRSGPSGPTGLVLADAEGHTKVALEHSLATGSSNLEFTDSIDSEANLFITMQKGGRSAISMVDAKGKEMSYPPREH